MTDQKTIDSIKQLIRKQIAEMKVEGEDAPKSMSEMAVALTKAAHGSLKALEGLKSKARMPSQKATDAISVHLDALERLFNDMWQSPLNYLDVTPDEAVTQRVADLDRRLDNLGPEVVDRLADHTVKENTKAAETAGGTVISDPSSCPTCGATYDKKLHKSCPSCAVAKKTNESAKAWASKLRSSKTAR